MAYTLFTEPHHFFFSKQSGNLTLYIRSLQLEQDLDLVHRWVNAPYARYWQMQGSKNNLIKYYLRQKEENITSTFFVCNGCQPIALFDVYQSIWTELRTCYDARQSDYGIHLLMAPHRELISLKKDMGNVSEKALQTIIEMLFSFDSVGGVIAEPDIRNQPAHRLAEKIGFVFQKDIQLSDKTAKLYIITKSVYQKRKQH